MGCRLVTISVFLCISWQNVSGQSVPDSLFHSSRPDTLDVIQLNQIAYDNYWNNPTLALKCAYHAKHIADTLQYYEGVSEAYRQIGVIAWAQGNLSTAHNNLLRGLQLAETLQNKQLIADFTGNLGLVYFAMGDHQQALLHQQRSLFMQQQLKNEAREAVALNNLGDVYRAQKEYKKAIESYTRALELRKKLNQPVGEATNLRNIGNVYEEMGDYVTALQFYNNSLSIAENKNDKRGKCHNLASIASVHRRQKQYTLAENKARAALTIAVENNYKIAIREIYKLLSEINEAAQNTTRAFAYYKQYAAYKDTVMNSEVAFEITAQRLDYETTKKQVVIENLQKDNLLQRREMGRKNVLLFTTGMAVFLLFLLLAIIVRNYKRQKMLNKLLALKNEEIKLQKKEIEDHRNELITLNEEITAQHEELIEQRDVLAQKNETIARMNAEITSINQNLENTVAKRTALLEKQNQQLKQYAFFNAHKLRAPLASILGLVNLLSGSHENGERKEIVDHLNTSAQELDRVVRSISEVIQDGLSAYDDIDKK